MARVSVLPICRMTGRESPPEPGTRVLWLPRLGLRGVTHRIIRCAAASYWPSPICRMKVTRS